MPQSLPDLLKKTAELFPGHCAYRCAHQEITYRRLLREACALAAYLKTAGVKKGDRVGILLHRNIEMVLSVYATLFAGAAYVPIDNTAPAERVSKIVEQCRCKLIITQTGLSHRVERDDIRLIFTDSGEEWSGAKKIKSSHLPFISQEDIAYIIFTSGTTGIPKGIVHSHASACAFATMMRDHYGLDSKDRITGLSPLHFDMSTFDLFASDAAGACTIVFSEAEQKIAASMTRLTEQESISVWYSTPFSLIQALDYGMLAERNLEKLRWVIYAGEAFPGHQLTRLVNAVPEARISNAYGPAEVNVCHIFDFPPGKSWEESAVPIGSPCRDVTARVVDDAGNPSATGELWISAKTMMNAYWQAPELTRKAMNCTDDGKWYYKTGDLVRIDDKGLYYFLGRRDRQIKLRGFRIELDDIEHALNTIPGVRLSSATVRGDEQGLEAIVADVQLREGIEFSENAIKRELAAKLPAHAVPQRIRIRSVFPMTSTGKVDRRLLGRLDTTVAEGKKC